MLSEFPIEDVKEFFNFIPLILDGREYKGKKLYQLLWKEKAKIPIAYDVSTDNRFERFILSKGRKVPEVLGKILWLNNKSSVLPGKILLTWFYPKLESLFNSIDTRDMVFALITLNHETWFPGAIHRRIRKREEGEWVKSIMAFILDPGFREYLDWDLELFGKPQVLAAPVMIGLPAFERFTMLSDCRPASGIIWEAEDVPVVDGEFFRIRGEEAGRRVSFLDFCRRMEVADELARFNPPDIEVIEMTVDYHCPKRERIVLHKGCAYGAPLFLHLIEHRKLSVHKRDVLGNIVADLVREEELQNDDLELKHLALLESISERNVFEFHESDESITLNGAYFTRGIPARILTALLQSWLETGKTEFEYSEFKRRFEISLGQKNSNFEVRFYRLIDKLRQECKAITIEKTGRGKFRLVVDGVLELKDG
ncbi:MAG: hypothetical protein ABIW76_17680 [Fibrobacteria bacterium]